MREHRLAPLARVVGHATHSRHPAEFTVAPVGAIDALLTKLSWKVDDVDLFEINEAFAMVTMIAMRELGLPDDRVNIFGGACAQGHPIGSTGSRLIVTLAHALKQRGAQARHRVAVHRRRRSDRDCARSRLNAVLPRREYPSEFPYNRPPVLPVNIRRVQTSRHRRSRRHQRCRPACRYITPIVVWSSTRCPSAVAASTYRSLAGLMNIHKNPDEAATRDYINAHTLVRKIECFDTASIPWQRNVTLSPTGESLTFKMQRRQLPDRVPTDWQISDAGDKDVTVTVPGKLHALMEDMRGSRVTSAGQVPTGFDPDRLYQSRSHPRGLALTIFGASDAVRSLGIDWDVLRQKRSARPVRRVFRQRDGSARLRTAPAA